jgi:hypothetical protein
MILLLSIPPLAWTGRWMWVCTALLAGLLSALSSAMNEIKEEDKQEIRYNVMDAEDVLVELQQQQQQHQAGRNGESSTAAQRLVLLAGLGVLAKKYGRLSSLIQKSEKKAANEEKNNSNNNERKAHVLLQTRIVRLREMALVCQQASYLGLDTLPNDDAVVAASLSLLALVAHQDVVRERHMQEANHYGLNRPIQCMRDALERAKQQDAEQDDTDDGKAQPQPATTTSSNRNSTTTAVEVGVGAVSREQQAAELQRKGCLLLGAVADGDKSMARLVAQEGGIEAIVQAADWYRYHAEVANWALWAIFTLSCEDAPIQTIVVKSDGVPVVIRALKHSVRETVDVARHGIAILFDLMREPQTGTGSDTDATQQPRLDVWKIRNAALTAGIHQAIVAAMEEYPYAVDIIMMGQAILAGTDYKGDVPQYQPIS